MYGFVINKVNFVYIYKCILFRYVVYVYVNVCKYLN